MDTGLDLLQGCMYVTNVFIRSIVAWISVEKKSLVKSHPSIKESTFLCDIQRLFVGKKNPTPELVSQTHWKPRPELDIDLNPDHPSPGD